MFDDKNAEAMARVRAAVEPSLVPGETLVGAMHAVQQSTFSGSMWAIGVTEQRLVLVPLDRKMTAKGPPTSVRPSEITKSSVDGSGGGIGHFAAALLKDGGDLRFDTGSKKWKFSAIGGLGGEQLLGSDYASGVNAVCQFLVDATQR